MSPERRKSQRVPIGQGGNGKIKASVPVGIRNLSQEGALLEVACPLRPGAAYDLKAVVDELELAVQVKITRCRAGGFVTDERGGRVLLYSAGAEFVTGVESPDLSRLKDWLSRHAERPPTNGSLHPA